MEDNDFGMLQLELAKIVVNNVITVLATKQIVHHVNQVITFKLDNVLLDVVKDIINTKIHC